MACHAVPSPVLGSVSIAKNLFSPDLLALLYLHNNKLSKDWCWSWNSNTLATCCKVLTQWKRPWCWERLRAGGEGDDRGWNGWMASPTQWTWVWASSQSWWWTGKPGVLQSMRSQRVGHDWVTELGVPSAGIPDFLWCWLVLDELWFLIGLHQWGMGFPGGSDDKESACNTVRPGFGP